MRRFSVQALLRKWITLGCIRPITPNVKLSNLTSRATLATHISGQSSIPGLSDKPDLGYVLQRYHGKPFAEL
jgi:hypothetical protein